MTVDSAEERTKKKIVECHATDENTEKLTIRIGEPMTGQRTKTRGRGRAAREYTERHTYCTVKAVAGGLGGVTVVFDAPLGQICSGFENPTLLDYVESVRYEDGTVEYKNHW
ncbi:hypothetical protein ACFQZ4_25095 [Catellatospora coxensis]|uniref:hypothetical protein n=1 Tax=Catellatospora coxensis TaxID=310354 RepID=UPI00194475C1|nr:hypothetical protein [Catellatospora coxensis]